MISFVHITATRNVGDYASGPYHYFRFPGAEAVFETSDPVPACDAVIYGGGTLTGWLGTAKPVEARHRIVWGTGSTRHGQQEPLPEPSDGFDLVGVREWSEARQRAGNYAPCASCMSPLFDQLCPVEHDAVLFVNSSPSIQSRYPVAVSGLPTMGNEGTMAETIEFLGSGATVITNSYHGVYWATLLGRGVVCLPYSSKFYGFKFPPVMSKNGGLDWRERSKEAVVHYDALEDCRAATRAFYGRVMELIG